METSLLKIMDLEWWERPSQITEKKELRKIEKRSVDKKMKILRKRRIISF